MLKCHSHKDTKVRTCTDYMLLYNFIIGAVLADSNHRSDHHDNHCNVSINDRSNNITWYTNGKFNEFNYWTLDNEPTEDDKLMKAMKWIKASQHVSSECLECLNIYRRCIV